jgi:hypothetical protein
MLTEFRESNFWKAVGDISVAHWVWTTLIGGSAGLAALLHGNPLEVIILYVVLGIAGSLAAIHYGTLLWKHFYSQNAIEKITRKKGIWGALIPVIALMVLIVLYFIYHLTPTVQNATPSNPTNSATPPHDDAPPNSESPSVKPIPKAKPLRAKDHTESNPIPSSRTGDEGTVGKNSQSAPPVVLKDSPGSAISFGQQGGITAGTVNIGSPEPQLTWSAIEKSPPENAKHPRAYARITVDRSFPDAKFAVICDRPCSGVEADRLPGSNSVSMGNFPGVPNVAPFIIIGPNPFPADIGDVLGVEPEDDQPVRILDVRKLALTDEQKRILDKQLH